MKEPNQTSQRNALRAWLTDGVSQNMKLVALMTAALLSGCVAAKKEDLSQASTTNLTEAEIRSLPSDITFDAVQKRLRYFSRSAVAIPLISFEIEGKKGWSCSMVYSQKSGALRYAWSERDGVILWPRELAGHQISGVTDLFEKKEANQSPEPMPLARHGSS